MSKTISGFLLMTAAAQILTAQPPSAPSAPDPTQPGPVAVTSADYRFDSVQIAAVPYPVDVWGTVWFPDGLPKGPYPLILFLHGNHGICRLPGTQSDVGSTLPPPQCPTGFVQTPNHKGYDYVASILASYGYIVVSINANAINLRPNGAPERGRLVQEHFRYWARWNSARGGAPFGKMFSRKVDLRHVGLMGHSRGGEGVRAAYNFNRAEGSPVEIKAVMELGPVDFGRTSSATLPTTGNVVFNADNVAWSVFLSSCDGDVFDNQGMRVYDRARAIREPVNPSQKSQIYIFGADHDFSNSEWLPEDPNFQCIDFPIITNRTVQQDIAKTYILGFFRSYLGGEDFKSLFTNDAKAPAKVQAPVIASFTESPESILMIDDFSDKRSPDINSAGGNNTTNNLIIKSCSGQTCNDPPPAAWLDDPAMFTSRISWPGPTTITPFLSMQVAPGGAPRDVRKYAMLAFRVAEEFSTKNPMVGQQNFSIRLVDASVNTSNLVTVDSYRSITYPTGYSVRRALLQTVRIPLADFQGVDLTRLTHIQFIFDRQPTGALFLTDVHLTP